MQVPLWAARANKGRFTAARIRETGTRGGWIFHQPRSWRNCRRSTADIDFIQVPDWSRDLKIWFMYLSELLEPSKGDLLLLKVAKVWQEGGWIFYQWQSWPLCTKSIADIDFSQVPDWSQDFILWCKFLYELLESTMVDL